MSKTPTLKMKNRLNRVVIALIVLGFLGLIVRVGYITIGENERFSAMASAQQLDDLTVNAKRGTIYDRNMKVLAQSATVWKVVISPADLKEDEKVKTAKALAEILDLDEKEVLEKANEKNRYQIIKKQVEKPEVDKITKFKEENDIYAVYTIEDSKRYYPYGNFASTVIGFTGDENQGLYGIEAYYDDYLKGTPGRIVTAVNANGTDMKFNYEKYYEPKNGNGLMLTIDESIQHFVEKTLEQVIVEHKVSNRACAIVMDVNTGEVLAMATKPDFDLNDPFTITDKSVLKEINKLKGKKRTSALSAAREAQWKNKAITELYEPGSVFKVVTGSAALEEKVVSLESTFHCNGRYSFDINGVKPIRCWKTSGHGTLDLTGAYVNSCNPAFITIGQKLGLNKFYQYFKSYGMTEKTGIDLPGEANSVTMPYDDYGIVELASASFGQTNAITPLQMITAFCAVVNGGYLVQPHVVKQQLDDNGNVVSTTQTTVKRQVISEETSKIMRTILEEDVTANGGSSAYIKGYRIGGKSGTSEKLAQNKDDPDARVSSFIGVAPANDPQIAVMVMVDEPRAGEVYGSVVAAPAVASIMADTLPYIGIEASYTAEEAAELEVTVPNVKGEGIVAAQNKITNTGLKYKVIGSGVKVKKQMPENGTTMPKEGTVVLYTSDTKDDMVTVPNVVGLTPSSANTELTNAGLNIKFTGAYGNINAKVRTQSVKQGAKIARGSVITVECIHSDETG